MVNVLRRGSLPKWKVTCTYCGSLLSFSEHDMQDAVRAGIRYTCINCPVCYENISVTAYTVAKI